MIEYWWFYIAALFHVLTKVVWLPFAFISIPLMVIWIVHWGLPNLVTMMKGKDEAPSSWGEKCHSVALFCVAIGLLVFIWITWR